MCPAAGAVGRVRANNAREDDTRRMGQSSAAEGPKFGAPPRAPRSVVADGATAQPATWLVRAIGRLALLTLGYAVLAVLFTWPLAAQLGSAVVAPIDPLDSIWRIARAQDQFLRQPLDLFQANTFYPYPRSYLFDELLLGSALLTLPLRLVTDNPVAIYNLATLASFALSGLAMYALGRRLGCHPVGAFAAGLIYAFAPLQMVHFGPNSGHLGLLSGQWFPLIILLLDRLFNEPRLRDALLLAATLIMQALSSQYYAFYLLFVVGGFVVLRLAQLGARRRFPSLATWGALAGAGALVLAIMLPIGISYRAVQQDHGFLRPFPENIFWSSNLGSFFSADGQNWLWGTLTAPVREQSGQIAARHLFPGLAALGLAVLGAVVGRRQWLPQYLILLGLGGALLALGPRLHLTADPQSIIAAPMPYQFLYRYLPGFDGMRVPARFGRLFALGVASLAGFGLTWLLARVTQLGSVPRPRLLVPLAFLVLVGIGVESLNRPYQLVPVPTGDRVPAVYRWLALQPPGIVVELPFLIPDRDDAIGLNTRYQYFSLYYPHMLMNGSGGVVPKAYKALALELRPGPAPRTLAILQGLNANYLVVHYDDIRLELGRQAMDKTRATLRSAPDQVREVAVFGETVVYQLVPAERFVALRAAIPREATVYLSREDAFGTYGAMLAWVLRDSEIRTRVRARFGEDYAGVPEPGKRYDYAILYRQEDPASVGFANATPVWEDDVVRVYKSDER